MSTPKVGDTVRVDVEGVVREMANAGSGVIVEYTDDHGDNRVQFPTRWCTVLAPPLKVGDRLVKLEQVATLPPKSIIAHTGCGALSLGYAGGLWTAPGKTAEYGSSDPSLVGATVLRIGGGS